MTLVSKVIHGFEVELDLDMDNVGMDSPDRVTGCFIIKNRIVGSTS